MLFNSVYQFISYADFKKMSLILFLSFLMENSGATFLPLQDVHTG